MSKSGLYLSALLVFILSLPSFGQNEGNVWYFGNKAGLDFSTNPPTVLTHGALTAQEGCASICDSSGHIILYTDGRRFWNKNDSLIATAPNSNNYNRTQSCVIIPGAVYSIFTIDFGYGFIKSSQYDPTLNGGLGGFVFFDLFLNSGSYNSAGDKITTINHINGKWTWLLVHSIDNRFYAHLFDSTGAHITPITSVIGTNVSTNNPFFKGYMKGSPDGKRIAMAVTTKSTCELFKFDTSTGIVSDSLILSNSIDGVYGCEFSPDGSKIYASSWTTGQIYQWNLCAGSDSAILASQQIVGYCNTQAGALQLARNGKIYIANYNSNFLSVIHNPNAPGLACNFQNAAQSLGPATSYYGLPNFNASYFFKAQNSPILTPSATICAGETLTLSAQGLSSYLWSTSDTSPTLVVSPSVSSSYTVVGTNTLNSCPSEGVVTVNVSSCTEVEHLKGGEEFMKIYPNPSNGEILVETDVALEILIYNALGSEVLRKNLEPGQQTLDLKNLNKGVYTLQANREKHKRVLRLVLAD